MPMIPQRFSNLNRFQANVVRKMKRVLGLDVIVSPIIAAGALTTGI